MTTRRELANCIRALSMDAVQRANSGHPGMPMGMADIAQVLWGDFLKHNPGNPLWIDRDRFVLSNGHGSMLLYSLLYLTGYPLGLEEIKNLRQFGRRTAGHPEHEPGLGKLIVFYDDNGISIDGKLAGWFSDDTAKRFAAYHWHVVPNVDGNDADAVLAALQA